MKKILAISLVLTLVLTLVACANEKDTESDVKTKETQSDVESIETSTTQSNKPTHTHLYSAATCTEAKKCSCGAIEGVALGHEFSVATCISPKTCERCKIKEGEKLEHNYDDLGLCCYCSSHHPNANIYIDFTDAFLEKAVKENLGILGKVSKYSMEKLTSIRIESGITDATDLKYAINLESISICTDEVQNLDILCGLNKLKKITFSKYFGNFDTSFMKNMNHVENVAFSGSQKEDTLKNLTSSKKLKYLDYDTTGQGLFETVPLENLNSLEYLTLRDPFYALNDNFNDLDLNKIDVTVLLRLPKLKKLDVYYMFSERTEEQTKVYEQLLKNGIDVNFNE